MSRRPHLLVLLVAILSCGALWVASRVHVAAEALPARISDEAFWRMVTEFSEPGGFFRSDNFISNEETFQYVIPDLQQRVPRSSVYLGVGPDQNFTYISAFRPKMAFIVDIRRQNMLQHLLYKALVEQSTDRVDFLSRLFSRAKPRSSSTTGPLPLAAVFDALNAEAPDLKLFQSNLRAATELLTRKHRFTLTEDDVNSIKYVYTAFYTGGPDIRYSFPRQQFAGRWFPSYAELMMATDERGQAHSYVASDESFRVLKEYEKNNLIVPIVGDFGGTKALRAVGKYLREHDATIGAFYTSNVEQYLFQGESWKRFIANVGVLPVNGQSTFIRSYFNMGYRYLAPPASNPNARSATLLEPIGDMLQAYRDGQIRTYYEVIARSGR